MVKSGLWWGVEERDWWRVKVSACGGGVIRTEKRDGGGGAEDVGDVGRDSGMCLSRDVRESRGEG